MENKYEPVSDEDIIALISESMDSVEEELPDLDSGRSFEDDNNKSWRYEYISEEEVARENGCWIDDDGHWIPMEDEYDW